MKGVRVDIEWYESGKVRSFLVADFARITAEGEIEALNPVVRFLLEDGTVETVLRAEQCRWDKEKGMARSDSRVRMERRDLVITGIGLVFNARNQVVRVLREARVESKRSLLGKFRPPGAGLTHTGDQE
jgi:LPS export ABC transporter protein LptC